MGPLVEDQPGEQLTVTRNVASYRDDAGLGVLMLHFHNPVGDKAQVVALTGAESATELSTTPGKLTAKVKAVGDGLPEPSGEVTFSVDGTEVGSATVEDGSAILKAGTPSRRGSPDQGRVRRRRRLRGLLGSSPSGPTPGLTARIKTRAASGGASRLTSTSVASPTGRELTQDCPYPGAWAGMAAASRSRPRSPPDGGKATVTVEHKHRPYCAPGEDQRRPARSLPTRGFAGRVASAGTGFRVSPSCGIRWKRRGKRVIYTATGVDRAGNRRTVGPGSGSPAESFSPAGSARERPGRRRSSTPV